jgi:hypothetical protein
MLGYIHGAGRKGEWGTGMQAPGRMGRHGEAGTILGRDGGSTVSISRLGQSPPAASGNLRGGCGDLYDEKNQIQYPLPCPIALITGEEVHIHELIVLSNHPTSHMQVPAAQLIHNYKPLSCHCLCSPKDDRGRKNVWQEGTGGPDSESPLVHAWDSGDLPFRAHL